MEPPPLRLDTRGISGIGELYSRAAAFYGDKGGFYRKNGPQFEFVSLADLAARGRQLAAGLLADGLRKGEFVGLFADSSVDWLEADFGIQMAGGVDVPRGTDITADEMRFIVEHSGLRWLFLGNARAVATWQKIAGDCPRVEHVYSFSQKDPEAPPGFSVLREKGERAGEDGQQRVAERLRVTEPDDLFTVIYTSGTTGTPKGVQLTHGNMLSQVRNLPFDFGIGDRFLSILPVWHIYERVFETMAISRGCRTWFSSVKSIRADLREVRPTVMASAPRLWENLHDAIRRKVEEGSAIRRALFRTALACAEAVREMKAHLSGQVLDTTGLSRWGKIRRGTLPTVRGLLLWTPLLLLDRIVLRKLRDACGGCLRGTISGGGALPPGVDRFFNDIGIPVCEGYGLTETCPVVAVRLFENLVLGTVGPLYPETEIRIVDPESGRILHPDASDAVNGRGRTGEIHVKGPQVMRGYYRNEEATRAVLSEDGWFRTGDLGMMTFNDCLKIAGRLKETIVLLNGENVEPVPIENRLVESKWIAQCMVVGQDRKYLAALIVPSFEDFQKEIPSLETHAECAEHPDVEARIRAELRRIVSHDNGFKPHERVQTFHLLPAPFEVGKELTRTYKLRRHIVDREYKEIVDSLYR